jgi:hypothetical protein
MLSSEVSTPVPLGARRSASSPYGLLASTTSTPHIHRDPHIRHSAISTLRRLPRGTEYAENSASARKRSRSPVRPSDSRVFSSLPCDATQTATSAAMMRFTASAAPGTGLSSR